MEKSKKKVEKKKKTNFQNIWLAEPEMKEWLSKATDDTKFSCTWCKVTDLNLSNSGRKAVVVHMNTAKHKAAKNLKHQINFFAKHGSSAQTSSSHQPTVLDSSSSPSSPLASSQQPTISG